MTSRAQVLIIQGDSAKRSMLELALSYNAQGFQVSTAPSGQSGLLQLGVVRPDLILLDLSLPNGDAWDTLQRIRELSTVPIIALSTVDDPDILIRSLERGADYCLAQPWRSGEICARMRALLRREQRSGQPARRPIYGGAVGLRRREWFGGSLEDRAMLD